MSRIDRKRKSSERKLIPINLMKTEFSILESDLDEDDKKDVTMDFNEPDEIDAEKPALGPESARNGRNSNYCGKTNRKIRSFEVTLSSFHPEQPKILSNIDEMNGAMRLSYRLSKRINKGGPLKSPIFARTLCFSGAKKGEK